MAPEPTLTEGRAATDVAPVLRVTGLTKTFGGTTALKDFDFTLERGEIHGLLGENGAGKSTFIKLLAGVYNADRGVIEAAGTGEAEGGSSPMAFIHQDLALVPNMTIAENFALVAGFPRRFGCVDRGRMNRVAHDQLATLGLDLDPERLISELSVADRTLVAIARTLRMDAEVLILDEPSASLPPADVDRLFGVLNSLRERGCGMIYVSHRLPEIRELCDRVTVLRDGEKQATRRTADVSAAELAELIMGREVHLTPQAVVAAATLEGTPRLVLDGVTVGAVGPVDVEVRRGEILGLAGLKGAGHELVGRAIAGACASSGRMTIDGQPYDPASITRALDSGVAYVTGDRTHTLAANLTIRENLFLNPSFSSHPAALRLPKRERRAATSTLEPFNVRSAGVDAPIASLSGGNAQKVAIARGLSIDPRVLVLEEPTAGVDVGTRSDFYAIVAEAASNGLSIIVCSSDSEEMAFMAHRVLVFGGGRVADEIAGDEITIERLSFASMGAATR